MDVSKVVSFSHLKLVKARRALIEAHRQRDWEAVQRCDHTLTQQLDLAFDDPQRDQQQLLGELESILALYASMVTTLPPMVALHGH